MVDLILVPEVDYITNTVLVHIVAEAEEPTRLQAMDLGFFWNPKHLTLVTSTNDFATVGNTMAGLPCPVGQADCGGIPLGDFYGVNETYPPADGTGYFTWLSTLGIPVIAETAVLGTLVFEMNDFIKTEVLIIDSITIDYPFRTVMYGTEIPGLDVTGLLQGCKINGNKKNLVEVSNAF